MILEVVDIFEEGKMIEKSGLIENRSLAERSRIVECLC